MMQTEVHSNQFTLLLTACRPLFGFLSLPPSLPHTITLFCVCPCRPDQIPVVRFELTHST